MSPDGMAPRRLRIIQGQGKGDIARMARATMRRWGLATGDILRIGPRATHVRIAPGAVPPDCLALPGDTRENCGTPPGDETEFDRIDLPEAESVTFDLSPARDALIDRPVTEGDRIGAAAVLSVRPAPAGRITDATRLVSESPARAYPRIGGMEEQIARLREMIALPLSRPDLFRRIGVQPPRGVLFTGPPGTGKTLLARAIAEETEASFFQIAGPEIVSKHYGDSEARLREIFAAAQARAPAIIFIDEIDAIAARRDTLSAEKQLERRVVAQLLTLMDGLSERGEVIVMAATNLPQSLDPALRRPGRFDREVAFGPPDTTGREEILRLHSEGMPLAGDVDLARIAEETRGYVGADLAALVQEAAMGAITRAVTRAGGEAALDADAVTIKAIDFDLAQSTVGPSILRGAAIETPQTRWSDVGGLDRAKAALAEAVIWPLRHGEAFRRLNLPLASGVLLAGPPGTGKTLLARALAGESRVNFVPVRGSSLLGQHLGEAERAVAEIFARARQAAPCILFFDEVDAVAPVRGRADAVFDRIVAELLMEIDGIRARRDVFLLGATNRIDAIDPALLRPGRFDLTISLDPPDAQARRAILEVHARGLPLDPSVDLDNIALRMAGKSGADLAACVQRAARASLRRAIRDAGEAALDPDRIRITAEDFATAFDGAHLMEGERNGSG